MIYIAPTRNYTGIQFESIRKTLDAKFNQAHDDLSSAYYDFWSKGLSKPWRGFDVQPTPEASKVLFDKLHALIFHIHQVVFHTANLALPLAERYSEDEYRWVKDELGNILEDKIEAVKAAIRKLKDEGLEIIV